MFDKDFYPTPDHVIETMLQGLDLQDKHVLEPSAGAGAILDALNTRDAHTYYCEREERLEKICRGKGLFIAHDFLTVTAEDCAHLNFIIANPPFSEDDTHILKMWEVAPAGCTIRALCNAETLRNTYVRTRKELQALVELYGDSVELGSVFAQAERPTYVNVSMVTLHKPGDSEDFSRYFSMDVEPEDAGTEGLMPYNSVRDVVQRVTGAMKLYEEQLNIAQQMNALTKAFPAMDEITLVCKQDEREHNRRTFRAEIQKKAWRWIFRELDMEKYMTTGVRTDINKFVEEQVNVPFTMKNVYRMLDMVVQKYPRQIEKSLIEVFERLTRHYRDNRYHVEGWKTNSHYLVNQTFILPYMVEIGFSGRYTLRQSHWIHSNRNTLADLVKVLCYITGTPFEITGDNGRKEERWPVYDMITPEMERNTWYEWAFFEFKFYKKGTMHLRFKDEKVWYLFNQRVAEIMGFPLPEKV